MTNEIDRTRIRELAARPYTFTLVYDAESDVWTSGILELPGAISEGDDPNEAITFARQALELMIELRLEDGEEIPEPLETRKFSGRMQLRLNPELHRKAAIRAAEEHVSLNRWLSASIARSTGVTATPVTQPAPAAPAAVMPPSAAGALRAVAEESEDYRTTD